MPLTHGIIKKFTKSNSYNAKTHNTQNTEKKAHKKCQLCAAVVDITNIIIKKCK